MPATFVACSVVRGVWVTGAGVVGKSELLQPAISKIPKALSALLTDVRLWLIGFSLPLDPVYSEPPVDADHGRKTIAQSFLRHRHDEIRRQKTGAEKVPLEPGDDECGMDSVGVGD